MRFEAEVDSGKGREVWAAIEELAAGYLKEEVAATMDQARADAFVDLILANAAVSTMVDLALPAGFATAGAAPGGLVLEQAATGLLVDVDKHTRQQTGQDTGWGAGPGAVARVLAGLPAGTFAVRAAVGAGTTIRLVVVV
jgi:hypothetical protein